MVVTCPGSDRAGAGTRDTWVKSVCGLNLSVLLPAQNGSPSRPNMVHSDEL